MRPSAPCALLTCWLALLVPRAAAAQVAEPEPLADPTARFAPPAAALPPIPVEMPVVLEAPTADLPPGGVIIGRAGVGTAGGLGADLRVGLGGVAELGIGTTDLVRVRRCDGAVCNDRAVQPYPLALFQMGVAEDRLFRHQPALALGFRKSFERDHDDRTSQVAELYLVASKRLGHRLRVHAGGELWDAGLRRSSGDASERVTLHDRGVRRQLRAFGGLDLAALPRSHLLVELDWVPELRLGEPGRDWIALTPTLAWGVRYQLSEWAMVESGVRVPDVGDLNLLDAQIFGQLRLVSRRLARFAAER